jgi:hypothetical protein
MKIRRTVTLSENAHSRLKSYSDRFGLSQFDILSTIFERAEAIINEDKLSSELESSKESRPKRRLGFDALSKQIELLSDEDRERLFRRLKDGDEEE